MVTEVSPLQVLKAETPILVTELGMVRAPVRPLQPAKASFPILVTELGIVIEVNPVNLPHNPAGIIVILFPKVKLVILLQPSNG